MVEAAVVFPLLFLVLFGIVELGWAFKDSLSVGHGAREAARAGATFGNDAHANMLVLEEVEEVMSPVGIATGLRVRIYNPDSSAGDTYTFALGANGGCNWSPCPNPDTPLVYTPPTWLPTTRDVSAPFTGRIGVRVIYTHQWITKLFASTTDLTKDVTFQLEPQVFDP
jgi:Flp pilus assembly protein TadG